MIRIRRNTTTRGNPCRVSSVFAGVIAVFLTASCSSSPDALGQLGLTPTALQNAQAETSRSDDRGEVESATAPEAAEQPAAAGEDRSPSGEIREQAELSQDPEQASGTVETSESTEFARPQRTNIFASLLSARDSNAAQEDRQGRPETAAGDGQPAEQPESDDAHIALAAELTRTKSGDGVNRNDAPERRNLLSAFFAPAEQPASTSNPVAERDEAVTAGETGPQQVAARSSGRTREITEPIVGSAALPGVRDNDELFNIVRSSGSGDNSDVDLYEQSGSYEVASAAGLARLAPNGLLKQRDSVDVSCFKPRLVQKLKRIERHFGKRVVVTSGYRSPAHNKRVRGARNSLHMSCSAADIHIKGVGKWELARFARSIPGRGGVGTYCHTRSVHVDVGPERDWNWSC